MYAHEIVRVLNRRTSLIGLALTVAMAGCSDTTAPHKPFALSVTVDAPTPTPVFSDTPDGPRITCNIGLTAKATGDGSAQWQDVRTFFYFGTNRSLAADSISNAASDVRNTVHGAAPVQAARCTCFAGIYTKSPAWPIAAFSPFICSSSAPFTIITVSLGVCQ